MENYYNQELPQQFKDMARDSFKRLVGADISDVYLSHLKDHACLITTHAMLMRRINDKLDEAARPKVEFKIEVISWQMAFFMLMAFTMGVVFVMFTVK